QVISRGDAATLIARADAGGDALVPATGMWDTASYNCAPRGVSLFEDVSPTDPACRYVHYLASRLTIRCDASRFCPSASANRGAMASLVAQASVQPQGDAGVPVSYGPDPSTGRSYNCDPSSPTPDVHFNDVPSTDPLCKHVHYLWANGIVE